MGSEGIEIKNLSKRFGRNTTVLNGIDLKIQPGEFIVLVGPSGCGKSTLLRVLAGLESPTSGEIRMGNTVVNDVHPSERNLAMVFQDYALYPHMTIRQNLSFGLRMNKVDAKVIEARVEEVAQLLQISNLLARKPAQLSGGQRQRVAIGRALIKNPSIFLFDEPLSNLDAQLRQEMRVEIAELHKRLKPTIVYVTHDQVEAMTLAHRIVLLNKGVIQQVGTPLEMYNDPANAFVASFIGSPSMGFLKGELNIEGTKKSFRLNSLKTNSQETLDLSQTKTPNSSGSYLLGLRPEKIKLLRAGQELHPGRIRLSAKVLITEPLGHEALVIAELKDKQQITLRITDIEKLRALSSGESIEIGFSGQDIYWFDPNKDGIRVR